jgi:hypothetical protein
MIDGMAKVGAVTAVMAKLRTALGPGGSLLANGLAKSTLSKQTAIVLRSVLEGSGIDADALKLTVPKDQHVAFEVGRVSFRAKDLTVPRQTTVRGGAARAIARYAGVDHAKANQATLDLLADYALKGDVGSLARALGGKSGAVNALVGQAKRGAQLAGEAFDLGVIAQRADTTGASRWAGSPSLDCSSCSGRSTKRRSWYNRTTSWYAPRR